MNTITDRIKEIYLESGVRSVNAFAKLCGIRQRSMDGYMKSEFQPKIGAIEKILCACPEYNREWLISGIGEKFNRNLVPEHADLSLYDTAENNSQEKPSGNDALIDEIRKSRERLIARMIRRLRYTAQLQDIEAMRIELASLVLDLQDEAK